MWCTLRAWCTSVAWSDLDVRDRWIYITHITHTYTLSQNIEKELSLLFWQHTTKLGQRSGRNDSALSDGSETSTGGEGEESMLGLGKLPSSSHMSILCPVSSNIKCRIFTFVVTMETWILECKWASLISAWFFRSLHWKYCPCSELTHSKSSQLDISTHSIYIIGHMDLYNVKFKISCIQVVFVSFVFH